MIKTLSLATGAVGLMLSAASAGAAAGSANKDDDQIICKQQKQTGTRFKKKVCRTAAEWEAIAEGHRNGLKESVDRPQVEIRKD